MFKVMLVDDSKAVRHVIKNVLSRMLAEPQEVLEAGDGEEAMTLLQANSDTGMIFLDVNMPKMNGDIFLEKVRKIKAYNSIRIIMVTTESEKGKVVKIMKLGPNGFIIKPFTPESMRKSLIPIFARMNVELTEE